MKKAISALLCAALLVCACAAGVFAGPAGYDQGGRFEALLVGGMEQTQAGDGAAELFLKTALEQKHPDLVIFMGGNTVDTESVTDYAAAVSHLTQPCVAARTPFTCILGARDYAALGESIRTELGGTFAMLNAGLQVIWREAGADLYYTADALSDGFDRAIHVRDAQGNVTATLFLYNEPEARTGIDEGQLTFFGEVREENPDVPAYVFTQKALPEVYTFYSECPSWLQGTADLTAKVFGRTTITKSVNGVNKCLVPFFPMYDGLLFEAPEYGGVGAFGAFKADGHVSGVFSAYDLKNSYRVNVEGIGLVSVPGSGTQSGNNFTRGAALLSIRQNDPSVFTVTTYTYKAAGKTVPELSLVGEPFAFGDWCLYVFETLLRSIGWGIRSMADATVAWQARQA